MLYLVYFPTHLRYQRTLPLDDDSAPNYGAVGEPVMNARIEQAVAGVKPTESSVSTTPEWRLAITLGWVVVLHL